MFPIADHTNDYTATAITLSATRATFSDRTRSLVARIEDEDEYKRATRRSIVTKSTTTLSPFPQSVNGDRWKISPLHPSLHST